MMFTKIASNHAQNFLHGHKAVFIGNNRILVFGGGNNGFCKEILIYNIENNVFERDPKQRLKEIDWFTGLAAHQVVLLNDKKRVLIFGGTSGNGFSNALYLLENTDWFNLKQAHQYGEIPCPRLGHSFTVIDDERVVLFGGVTSLTFPQFLNDLYILHIEDDNTFQWEKIEILGDCPPPRESHSAVLYDNQLIIFVGNNGTSARLNDVWILDLETFTWEFCECSGTHPSGRSLHSANIIDDKMYIFGGYVEHNNADNTRATNELFYLDLNSFEWDIYVHLLKPEARANHAVAEHEGRIYIFSGKSDRKQKAICLNDIWILETKVPPKVKNVEADHTGISFVPIRWKKTANVVNYVIEIQVVADEKPMLYELIEPVQNDRIIVKKNNALKVDIKKPKIIIQEHKILTPADPMGYRKLSLIKSTPTNKVFKISPSGALISEDMQLDGTFDDVNRLSETESETETKEHQQNNARWFLVGFCKDSKYKISTYHMYTINRSCLTSQNLPRLSSLGTIKLKSNTSYYVRVSGLNSCGISQPSKTITVKTQRAN